MHILNLRFNFYLIFTKNSIPSKNKQITKSFLSFEVWEIVATNIGPGDR